MHKRYPFSSSFISAGRQVQRVAQKKKPRIFPPRCFLLASSWSMMPPEVVSTTNPNCLLGRRLFVHFSMSLMATSNLGEMTPHLLSLPVRLMTILPALWSSTTSNSPMYPCFIMTVRNLMTTLEQGRQDCHQPHRAPQQVWCDLTQVRCCHRRHREVDKQPPALQTVRARGADHLRGHHGPRGGQEEASRRKDPGILLLNLVMKPIELTHKLNLNHMLLFKG